LGRAALLLFATLEDIACLPAYASGFGLCLQHFFAVLALGPKPEARDVLERVQRARLTTLHWELGEFMRKMSWTARPEGKGAEQNAWVRAVERFSGPVSTEVA
jgi:hypothetical protein